MTLTHERFNAMRKTRAYLESIIKREKKFPTTIKESIEDAYWMLKHFPEPHWIDKVEELYRQEMRKEKPFEKERRG